MMLIRIVSPGFVAGVVVRNGKVTDTAPILRQWRGKSWPWEFHPYVLRRGWEWEVVGKVTP